MPFSGQASFCFDCEYSAQEVWGCRIVRFPSEYFREHVDSKFACKMGVIARKIGNGWFSWLIYFRIVTDVDDEMEK